MNPIEVRFDLGDAAASCQRLHVGHQACSHQGVAQADGGVGGIGRPEAACVEVRMLSWNRQGVRGQARAMALPYVRSVA